MYEIKKEEYKTRDGLAEEMVLYHATSESNVLSIIMNNFDWRMTNRNKFGKGVSFSDNADYANFYSSSKNGMFITYKKKYLYRKISRKLFKKRICNVKVIVTKIHTLFTNHIVWF